MRALLRIWHAVAACALAGVASNIFAATPTVTSISTTSSPPGPQLTNVTITGSGFALGSSFPNPPGASSSGGHNYLYVGTSMSWTDARAYCQSLNGHLATIGSANENTFVSLMASGSKWIGLTDEAVEGTFVWSNGEPLVYTNWSGANPDNAGNQDYVQMLSIGTWDDTAETPALPFVCEFDTLPPPAVYLKKGATQIAGTNVRLNSSSQLVADFNLGGAPLGTYDVVVTDPDSGTSGTLAGAFTVAYSGLFKVVSITPPPDSSLLALSSIVVDFSAAVNAATFSSTSVLLIRAGTDGSFDTADDAIIPVPPSQIQLTAANRLTISLSGLSIPVDKYRLSLIGAVRGTTGSSDKMITVPNIAQNLPTNVSTVEFWQRFDGASTNTPTTFELNPIVTNNNFRFRNPWNSGPDALFWSIGSETHTVNSVNTRGAWHHFALVKNGNNVQIYWNGALLRNEASTSAFSPYAGALELPHSVGTQIFIGRIDEFRIWNTARTQAEVQNYMKRTLRGNEPGLMAYWDFNDGVGTTATDRSGHGYNGTMASPPVWNTSDAPLLPPITDGSGNILDGDYSGTLPSGDGTPGGDLNATFNVVTAFAASAMTPAPGTTQTSLSSVLVTFTGNLDPATVSASSVKVKRAGPDNTLDTGDDVSVTAAGLSIVNGNQLKIDMPGQFKQSEKYRVTLNGTTLPVLKSSGGGITFDGEYPGSTGGFPTGNGTVGGDFTAAFQADLTVTTTVAATPQPVTYGTASVGLLAGVYVVPAQNINTGSISFQLRNGATDVGSPVTGNVTQGTTSVNYPLPPGTAPGTYTIVATYNGGGPFTASSSSAQLVINKAPLSVAANSVSRGYGSANPVIGGTLTGVQYSENITATYTTSATAGSDVGSYVITPVLVDPDGKLINYQISSSNGTLTITKVPLSVTASNVSRAYGVANPNLTGSLVGVVNNDDITSNYSTSATAGSDPGTYSIVPTLIDPNGKISNYTVTKNNGTLTVTKAPINVLAANANRTYGAANPVFNGLLTGVVNGDNILAAYDSAATATSSVGTYSIVPALLDPDGRLPNYTVNAVNGTLTVGKAALSLKVDSYTRPFGAANPTLTGTVSGIQNGDNIAASMSTTAVPSSALGSYPILGTFVDPDSKLPNYLTAITDGVLIVVKATPVIEWPAPARVVAGTSLSGVQLNATAKDAASGAALPGVFAYAPVAGTVLAAGLKQSLNVTFTPDDAVNYNSAQGLTSIDVDAAVLPHITSALTATVGRHEDFAYTLTAGGSLPIKFDAAGLPEGLVFSGDSITGAATVTGVFFVTLSATNFGGKDSKTLKLVVTQSDNHAPAITSAPAANPNPALVGEAVTFAAQASDPDGDALDYGWDFGDATFGRGASVIKIYTAPGVYVAKLTVSDGQAGDSQSVNVVVQEKADAAGSFRIEKLKVSFNFVKKASDSLSFSGQVPLAAGFDPSGKGVRMLIGLLDKELTLNSKGQSADKSFALKFKKGAASAGFTFKLSKEDLFAKLEDLGFGKSAAPVRVEMPVVLVLDGRSHMARGAVTYAAKVKKGVAQSGMGK